MYLTKALLRRTLTFLVSDDGLGGVEEPRPVKDALELHPTVNTRLTRRILHVGPRFYSSILRFARPTGSSASCNYDTFPTRPHTQCIHRFPPDKVPKHPTFPSRRA